MELKCALNKQAAEVDRVMNDVGPPVDSKWKIRPSYVLGFVALGLAVMYAAEVFSVPPAAESDTMAGPVLDDVCGCEEAKRKARGFISLLRHPDILQQFGFGSIPGVIFLGPRGTGKRLLSKAMANEGRARFVEIRTEDLERHDFDHALLNIGRELNKTLDGKPTVIFVQHTELAVPDTAGRMPSNLDLLRPTTSGGLLLKTSGGSLYSGDRAADQFQLLAALLSEYEKVVATPSVKSLLIVSTSSKQLCSFGGFQKFETAGFENPTRETRVKLFRAKLRNMMVKQANLDEWYEKWANKSHGLNGQDISRVSRRSAIVALSKNKSEVEAADVEEALEEEVKAKPVLTEWERRTVAFHEAGHAVVSWKLEHADEMLTVSIVPDNDGALGFTEYNKKGRVLHTREQVFAKICVALAGRYAEKLFFNRITTGARDDLQKATALSYMSVASYGLNDDLHVSFDDLASFRRIYGDVVANKIDTDVRALIAKASKIAHKMVNEYKDQIQKVATTLLDKETLNFMEMEEILGPASCKSYDQQMISRPSQSSLPIELLV